MTIGQKTASKCYLREVLNVDTLKGWMQNPNRLMNVAVKNTKIKQSLGKKIKQSLGKMSALLCLSKKDLNSAIDLELLY